MEEGLGIPLVAGRWSQNNPEHAVGCWEYQASRGFWSRWKMTVEKSVAGLALLSSTAPESVRFFQTAGTTALPGGTDQLSEE